MTRLIPFLALVLAACDAPLEHQYPPRTFTLDYGDHVLDIRAQRDPFQGWYTNVSSRYDKLESDDMEPLMLLVENQIGPQVCNNGKPLKITYEVVWTGFSDNTIRFLPEIGAYRFTGVCTGKSI